MIETVFLDAGGVLVWPNWQRVTDALRKHGIAADPARLAALDPLARYEIDRAPDRRFFELALARTGGKHVKSVLIALTPGPLGPRTIKIEDVLVDGYSFLTLPGTTDPMESLSFDFAKITVTFDGAVMCWDFKTESGC